MFGCVAGPCYTCRSDDFNMTLTIHAYEVVGYFTVLSHCTRSYLALAPFLNWHVHVNAINLLALYCPQPMHLFRFNMFDEYTLVCNCV